MYSKTVSESASENFDPYDFLKLTRNPDGSLTRSTELLPECAPSPESDPNNPIHVLSKDIPINQEKNTWARVYVPRSAHQATAKLPLIVYFHGGGFVIGSAATSMFHKFCNEIVEEIQAVMVSVDYRLAPEHRLPAAYDDCTESLYWIRDSNDEWLANYADFSKCFLMGLSAGSNIVYNVGLRAISLVDELAPVKIRGLILHHPFFDGVERTPSQIRLMNGETFPLRVSDMLWDLGLPVGANRDHEYCNPMVAVRLDLLAKVKSGGWKVLVFGCDGDLFIDRQIEFVKMLKEKGIDVVGEFSAGGFHGVELLDESRAKILYDVVKNFVLSF